MKKPIILTVVLASLLMVSCKKEIGQSETKPKPKTELTSNRTLLTKADHLKEIARVFMQAVDANIELKRKVYAQCGAQVGGDGRDPVAGAALGGTVPLAALGAGRRSRIFIATTARMADTGRMRRVLRMGLMSAAVLSLSVASGASGAARSSSRRRHDTPSTARWWTTSRSRSRPPCGCRNRTARSRGPRSRQSEPWSLLGSLGPVF